MQSVSMSCSRIMIQALRMVVSESMPGCSRKSTSFICGLTLVQSLGVSACQ